MTSANPYGTGSASPPARPATSSASGPPGAGLPGAGPPRTATPRPAAQRARVPGTGTDNQVITGEAVALDLAPASALSRLMSGVIDLILYASTGAAVLILATGFAANDAQLNTMAIVAFALTMVVLPTAVETLTRGLSAGRLAVGLRIVRDDGGPVQFRQALIRALAGIGEIWLSLGAVALITSIIHPRGKRLGDLVAGTYSLRVRESETARAPLLMPAELRPWAEIVDLGRIPDALALQARVYLSRTGDLHPLVRADVGRRFAAALESYVSPPPPWGTDPERFVAAVLVTRRDRAYLSGVAAARREQEEADRVRALPFQIHEHP